MAHLRVFDDVNSAAIDGRLTDLRYRQLQLQILHSNLVNNSSHLLELLGQADNLSQPEAHYVLAQALQEVRVHYDALDLKRELKKDFRIRNGESDKHRTIAYPTAYLIPQTYMLILGIISVLSCAIEAGSCLVVELENSLGVRTEDVQRYILAGLDAECFAAIEQRPSNEVLQHWLVIDQTWQSESPIIGKTRLLSAPDRNVVAIVDRTANLEVAATELLSSRLDFGGRSPQAVDAILVNEFVADEFLKFLTTRMSDHEQEVNKARNGAEASERQSFVQNQLKEGTEVIVDNGAAAVLRRSDIVLTTKIKSKVLVVSTFKSLDHVIDVIDSTDTSIAALMVFAGLPEANYVSRFIRASATYVNAIPRDHLIGAGPPLGFATSTMPRYERRMLEQPSSQFIRKPPKQSLDIALANRLLTLASKPLKPTGQAKAGQWDFFIVGFFLGAAVYVLPALAIGAFGVKWVVSRGVRSWW